MGRKGMSCKECLQAFRGLWRTRKYIHDVLFQKAVLEQMTEHYRKTFWLCLMKILLEPRTRGEGAAFGDFRLWNYWRWAWPTRGQETERPLSVPKTTRTRDDSHPQRPWGKRLNGGILNFRRWGSRCVQWWGTCSTSWREPSFISLEQDVTLLTKWT